MKSVPVIFAAVVLLIVAGLIVGVRVFGPHDLYEKDQPKTLAYTADILVNGRYALPRDVIYQPATKPPMYNWIDALVIKATRSWSEPVLKFPSILGSLVTGCVVFYMARRMTASAVVGCLAGAIWFTFGSDVRHGSVLRLGYLARPDMLQCAFLSLAWMLATIAIQRATRRDAIVPAFGFWICITAAALTKGPAAVMPIVFACAFALSACDNERPRWKNLLKLHAEFGVPLLILGVGAWLACAFRQDAQHVKSIMFGAEIASRVMDKGPEGIAKPFYYSAMWFITKAMPWGAVALVGVLLWARISRLRKDWAFAAIYLLVVLVCLSIPAGKRMDYLLPAYAPGAVLAAATLAWAAMRVRVAPALFMLLPLYLAGVMADRHLLRFHESIEHWSDHAVLFAKAVRGQVNLKQHHVLVLVRGKHPITTLLGQHPGSYLTRADLAAAEYVIAPEQPDWPALAISEPLPVGFETLETRQLARLALYRFTPANVPVDRLIVLQKQVADWTAEENPYHAAGTVYRDE